MCHTAKINILPAAAASLLAWLCCPTSLALAQEPAGHCAAVSGAVEQLICSDEELSALQVELADAYNNTLAALPAAERPDLAFGQQAWKHSLDECLTAAEPANCTSDRLLTRTVWLQIRSGQQPPPITASYSCEGEATLPITAAYYNATVPASAVLARGQEQVIALRTRSASGSKYAAEGVELWEHHGEATVYWFGTELKCRVVRQDSAN
jgi:uncharacterized protein